MRIPSLMVSALVCLCLMWTAEAPAQGPSSGGYTVHVSQDNSVDGVTICPAGDDTVRVQILDGFTPVEGIPPGVIFMSPIGDYYACPDDPHWDATLERWYPVQDTDSNGETFFYPQGSGCGNWRVFVSDTSGLVWAAFDVRSYDNDTAYGYDGAVKLEDFVNFQIAFSAYLDDGTYDGCYDYDGDSDIDLSDNVRFAQHFLDDCE